MAVEPLWTGPLQGVIGSAIVELFGHDPKAEVAVVRWPLPHDHDTMLDHLINEWGHLGVVMQVLKALTDDQASRLLDAARARVDLTPEALSGQANEEGTDAGT